MNAESTTSPIEEILAWALPKYLDPSVEIVREHPVNYRGVEFRLDFLLRHPAGLYGLECDGREYHSYFRDVFRDACILGVTDIAAIYRITGKDISFHAETALHLMAADVPVLFSPRGRANLCTLSQFRDESLIRASYDNVSAFHERSLREFVVMKLDRREEDQYWHELFTFAQRYPAKTMAEIATAYINGSSNGA
jgi:hypothetical protein